MICDACAAPMQRQIFVVVTHVSRRGKTEATEAPGWYCWACRTGRCAMPRPQPGSRAKPMHARARICLRRSWHGLRRQFGRDRAPAAEAAWQ